MIRRRISCCLLFPGQRCKASHFHLASATRFRFQEFEEIYHNEALTWLRMQPDLTFLFRTDTVKCHLTPPTPDYWKRKVITDTRVGQIADLGELLEVLFP
jgi:hypothetical protein